jgi:hypothetical protein
MFVHLLVEMPANVAAFGQLLKLNEPSLGA